VGKVYNLCRVKTDRSVVLTVKSGLDPHVIIKLEMEFKLWFIYGLRNNLIKAKFWVGIYLHLVNRCSLIKFDQLKMLTAENPSLPLIALHISPTG
jgi:hypothetical protein